MYSFTFFSSLTPPQNEKHQGRDLVPVGNIVRGNYATINQSPVMKMEQDGKKVLSLGFSYAHLLAACHPKTNVKQHRCCIQADIWRA